MYYDYYMDTKTCNKCNEIKTLDCFDKDSRNKDGLQGICCNCRRLKKQQERILRQQGQNIVPTETKTCNKCGKNKLSTEFYRDSGISDGRATICKKCKNETAVQWRKDNRERYNSQMREYHAKHYYKLRLQRYKLTPEEHNKMLIEQNHCCKICGQKQKGKRPLVVDHHHKTGMVRGLLCYTCNRAIAVFDNPILLEKAQAYLLKTKPS